MNLLFFFFNDTATTEIYTLSLHDALPISWSKTTSTTTKSPAWKRRQGRSTCTSCRATTTSRWVAWANLACRRSRPRCAMRSSLQRARESVGYRYAISWGLQARVPNDRSPSDDVDAVEFLGARSDQLLGHPSGSRATPRRRKRTFLLGQKRTFSFGCYRTTSDKKDYVNSVSPPSLRRTASGTEALSHPTRATGPLLTRRLPETVVPGQRSDPRCRMPLRRTRRSRPCIEIPGARKWPSPRPRLSTGQRSSTWQQAACPVRAGGPARWIVRKRTPQPRPEAGRSALPAKSGARRDAPGSRDMAAGGHRALSRERQPGAERLREPVLKPPSDARRAFAGAGDVFTGFDRKAGGEVPPAMLHLGPDLVLQGSDGQTGAAAERGQPEVADLRRILVVEIPISEQRYVGIAVQRGRRPGREPFVIERRRQGVEGREQVLAAVADLRMRVAVRDGLLAELLRGQRRSRLRADVRDALFDAVMGEGDPAVERPLQVGLAG